MKLVNLLNEARFRWKYKELPKFRQEPESVTGYRIVRRERGEDANVTLDDMMKILRNEEFVSNFKNKSYVFWVEFKTTRARKKVAFVHIFNVNNLPDYILPNIQTPYTTINGAKIFIKDPKKDLGRGDKEAKVGATDVAGDKGKVDVTGATGGQGDTGAQGATSTNVNIPSGTPLLKRGSRGESVKQLQTLLGLTGDSVDGKFGSETTAWLTVWQAEHGFTGNDIDGIYGPKTAAAMKKDPSPVKDTAKAIKLTTNVKDAFVSKTTTSKPAGDDREKPVSSSSNSQIPEKIIGALYKSTGGLGTKEQDFEKAVYLIKNKATLRSVNNLLNIAQKKVDRLPPNTLTVINGPGTDKVNTDWLDGYNNVSNIIKGELEDFGSDDSDRKLAAKLKTYLAKLT